MLPLFKLSSVLFLLLLLFVRLLLLFLFCEKQQLLGCYADFENKQNPFFYFGTDKTVSFDSLGPHKDFVFGTWDRDPADCTQIRGGGWWYGDSSNCAVWSNLNGVSPRCRNETGVNIHWAELVKKSAERSAPTSTEMKIRPIDFL